MVWFAGRDRVRLGGIHKYLSRLWRWVARFEFSTSVGVNVSVLANPAKRNTT